MSAAIASANPFLEFVSRGGNPLKNVISEFPQHCTVCGHKSHSLLILTFNMVTCQSCYDFILNCNYFNAEPIELNYL
jgi:hypothetical protein